jgi:hypothetical protein
MRLPQRRRGYYILRFLLSSELSGFRSLKYIRKIWLLYQSSMHRRDKLFVQAALNGCLHTHENESPLWKWIGGKWKRSVVENKENSMILNVI